MDNQPHLRSVLLIGVPDAGKSNFVFRLWLMLHAGTGMLAGDGLPADLDYLNGGGNHLLQGEFAPRTSREVHDQTEIPVKSTVPGVDFKGTLIVPDLPGEQILSIYRSRQWSEDWESKIRNGCGCLLFIRVDSKELIAPLDWMTAASHFGGTLPTAAPAKDEDGKDKPPTQVVLVDWLRFLRKSFTRKVGGTYQPRIGIVVSAWDLVPGDQKSQGPAKWIEDNLPLLSQYVDANDGDFDFEYFGVSVTEGDFDADPDFKAEYFRRDPPQSGRGRTFAFGCDRDYARRDVASGLGFGASDNRCDRERRQAMTLAHTHQLLHGYRSGHGQIAASIKLTARDSELITRLSDLSGSLSSGLEIEPYLTVYPLPSRQFFAIARTWPDLEAPRAGCVLTHTLLIPTEAWATLRDVRSLDSLFRNPHASPDYNFADPVNLRARSSDYAPRDLKLDLPRARSFVSRYFGQGLRPIVWFNASEPEDYLWRLLEHLWPRLRGSFSSCTFSLQQRVLHDRPFDLLFAPSLVYARFTKLPDQLIEPTSERKVPSSDIEPWSEYWARAFFSADSGLPANESELPIWSELSEDPTAVRKLSLVHELRLRAAQSPTAVVGAMDVVESLAHDAATAVPLGAC